MDDLKKIKFSNWYWKFPDNLTNGSVVKLIQVLKVHHNDLSEQMIQYDATYTRNHHVKEYKLSKTELILLFLKLNPNTMFTTIRRFTPDKYRYYNNSIGEQFRLLIEP